MKLPKGFVPEKNMDEKLEYIIDRRTINYDPDNVSRLLELCKEYGIAQSEKKAMFLLARLLGPNNIFRVCFIICIPLWFRRM